MTTLILGIGATKLFLAMGLGLMAWAFQRRTNRPELANMLWLLVLLTQIIPSVINLPLSAPGGAAGGAALPMLSAAASLGSTLSENLSVSLVAVWLFGSLALFIWSMSHGLLFSRALKAASLDASAELIGLTQALAPQMGLDSAPPVLVTAAKISPMIWWFGGRVSLVLPQNLLASLDDEALRLIVAHEFAHIKRRDHLVRWVEWAACVAFWWNPVVWIARRYLRSSEEQCCDAAVIGNCKTTSRKYAESLLSVVSFLAVPPSHAVPAFASEAVSGGRVSLIEKRLKMVISNRTNASTPRWMRTVVKLLVLASLPIGLVNCGSDNGDITTPQLNEATTNEAGMVDGNSEEARQRYLAMAKKVKAEVAAGEISVAEANRRLEPYRATTSFVPVATVVGQRLKAANAEVVEAVASGRITKKQAQVQLEGLRAKAKVVEGRPVSETEVPQQ